MPSATALLEHLGTVIACGPLGTGNVVKLVTNQLWFIAAAAIGEGFAVGLANGVELGTLWHAIKESVGDSFVVRHDAPSIFAGHYDPSFSLGLCLKDLGLLGALGANVGTPLPMTDGRSSGLPVCRRTLRSRCRGVARCQADRGRRRPVDAPRRRLGPSLGEVTMTAIPLAELIDLDRLSNP